MITQEGRDRVRESFARQSMMQTLTARLDALDDGFCRILSDIPPGALQQHGVGHAGLTFSIGDSAAGYAALTMMAPDQEVVTAEIKINLMAPARGDGLVAEGRVIRPGRRIMTVEANVWALDGATRSHVAVLLGTMVPVPIA
ncbi:PaaI family thioesterase [Aliiroseovarius subalbicans]|uniref:PaaI family thioesterase n=1 Tax=Aliiroseovarius subalbicans TaxID=2925840 RepID=UPI001F59957C|nr:PaaI family thioesterase [Aliiroseovarius subalbicans]MCI2397951.1 PaaI family thioesterase [Aliiroseovarius subalbicans]